MLTNGSTGAAGPCRRKGLKEKGGHSVITYSKCERWIKTLPRCCSKKPTSRSVNEAEAEPATK